MCGRLSKMQGFLPAVSLLIGVILASCEITLPDTTEVETVEPLEMGEIIDPNHETDATGDQRTEYSGYPEDRMDLDSDSRGASQRRDYVDTWLDLAKSKEFRNLPSSQRRRKKKKKTATIPWIYQWGNKKKESVNGAGSSVRMFRLPFNSWGGKRGSMTFSALQDNIYDRYGRFVSADGNDVKKKAEDIERVRGKIRFNSWGGKRSEQPRYVTYMKERVYDTPAHRFYKVYESIKGKKNGDKENNFIYRIPNQRYNETSQDDSSTDGGRCRTLLEERMELYEIPKPPIFVPWAGKRSIRSITIRLNKNRGFLGKLNNNTNIISCCYPIERVE